jgi:NAD(P)H-dependent FMN reductase
MRIFVLGASLRRESFNRRLASVTAGIARAKGAEVERGEFSAFPMPVYNGDTEVESGIPEGAKALSAGIKSADGLIFSAPEHNNSVSGPFKNAIDWLSREKPYSTAGKPVLLIGASSGKGAALLGLAATRIPLSFLKAHVYPTVFGLAYAETAFADDGERLKDSDLQKQLETLVAEFLTFVGRLSSARS